MEKKIIHATIVPWILNVGSKTSEEAKYFITKKLIEDDSIQNDFKGKNEDLSNKIGLHIFNISKNYKLSINNNVILLAQPAGITKDNTIIMVDTHIDTFKKNTRKELYIRLMTTLAVCNSNKGIYYIENLNEKISLDFNKEKWIEIYNKIIKWTISLK